MRIPVLHRLLREPLLHFAALGAALFVVHSAWNSSETVEPRTAVALTATDADWLKQLWTRQWGRPPTADELTTLVSDHLREELLAREAKALDLDLGDAIIRRRLAQKMAFMVDDTSKVAEPGEADLRRLYDTRADLVQTPKRVSFQQVFFRRGEGRERIQATLAALSNGSAGVADEGDSLLLGEVFEHQDEQSLANLFGSGFARAVLDLPAGGWSSPIPSGYGVHLVKVMEIVPPVPRPMSEVRDRLVEEWRRERQEAALAAFLQGLVSKYRVTADDTVRPYLGPFAKQVEMAR